MESCAAIHSRDDAKGANTGRGQATFTCLSQEVVFVMPACVESCVAVHSRNDAGGAGAGGRQVTCTCLSPCDATFSSSTTLHSNMGTGPNLCLSCLQVWNHALQFTAEMMLEGLARAGAKARCTMMGRAAMSLDLQVLML